MKMNNYRFILASNKVPKLDCPYCGSKKHWQRYIHKETGEVLPEKYGICDNANKCGQFLNPYKHGYVKMIWEQENGSGADFQKKRLIPYRPKPKQKIKKPVFIPYEILKATRKGYEQNIFIQNLLHRVQFRFHEKGIEQVIKIYHLGTICKGFRAGAITFPFIDINGRIRAIQAKQFDNLNHTLKDGTGFIHTLLKKQYENENKPLPDWLNAYLLNDKIVSCLFGEHLLSKYQTNPIALVEAPKTAIIGTLYFGLPDNPKNFLWLAVYNLSSLNIMKCKVFQGRKVFLFPDLNAYDNWSTKAKQIQKEMPATIFKVSDLIERIVPKENKNKGEDIADFLIRVDWKDFRKPELAEQIEEGKKINNLKSQLLDRIINEGTEDANLHLSGNITDKEFMQRQSIIEQKLIKAGIELDEYVMAFKK